MRGVLRRAWHGWKEFGAYLGDFQARVLLTVFYFTVLLPYGMITSAFGDPLRVRRRARGERTAWVPRETEDASLKRAGQAF